VGESVLRAAAFLAGLLGLRAGEVLAPDHPPTVPLARRWVANLGLGLVNGIVVSALCGLCFLLEARAAWPVPLPLVQWLPGLVPRIAVAVVLLDLVTYGLHRAYHRTPFLWRFHAVHHTDLDLDVSSASRFHTGEVVLSSAAKLGVVAALGLPAAGLVAFEVTLLACAQFQHANVSLPVRVERMLWRTFVPPAMHRIHHAPDRSDTDSNFGTILTLWDAAFGTLNRRRRDGAPAFGLPGARDPGRLGFGRLALLPFRPASGT